MHEVLPAYEYLPADQADGYDEVDEQVIPAGHWKHWLYFYLVFERENFNLLYLDPAGE